MRRSDVGTDSRRRSSIPDGSVSHGAPTERGSEKRPLRNLARSSEAPLSKLAASAAPLGKPVERDAGWHRFARAATLDVTVASPVSTSIPPTQPPVWRRLALWFLLLAAPLVVFHPITVGGFTFGQSPFASFSGITYGATETLPVIDPAAAASQDESWLVLIRRSLVKGEVPLVNMRNGLGAPLLETLQPGVLYPPNLLLLLFDGTKPSLFDKFELLHVLVLLSGLYVLFRLYARDEVALIVALTVGLSGIVYQHIDMVHFRSFAWMPLGLAAAVRIARGEGRTLDAVVFVAARVCAITAGALQGAFVTSVAIGAVFLIELWRSPEAAKSRLRRVLDFALLAAASTLIALPSVMPYLAARANGELFTQAMPDRSVTPLDGDALLSLLMPHAHGQYPHFLRPDRSIRWMSNFATVGVFFIVIGFVVVALRRNSPRRMVFLAVAAVTTLALLKIQHFAVFDFFQHIPFLNEILYTKYHSALFVLFGILGVLGLEGLLQAPASERGMLVARSTTVIGLMLGAMVVYIMTSPLWLPLADVPQTSRYEQILAYAGSIGAVIVAIVVLCWPSRFGLVVLAIAVIAQATLVVPNGWLKRLPRYWIPTEMQYLVGADVPERVLTNIQPNQNLIHDLESIALFDPVHLWRIHKLYARIFHLENAGFSLTPVMRRGVVSDRDLDLARVLGVTRIHGYRVNPLHGARPLGHGIIAVRGSLPRAFVLSREAFERIDALTTRQPIKWSLRDIRAELEDGPGARLTRVNTNGVVVTADRDIDGVLVVLQAYSQAWKLDGRTGMPFFSMMCAWDVQAKEGEVLEFDYWPAGLTLSIWLAALGAALATFAVWRTVREKRANAAGTRSAA